VRSVELFAGAGGLALAVSNAGFKHDLVIERDVPTCATIRENQRRGMRPVVDWPLLETDVRSVDYRPLADRIDLVAGGPPCQPFSVGGKHKGHEDDRNMFPEAVRAVRELRPRAFILENVKGLLRECFSSYFEYIRLQLSYPEIVRAPSEAWTDHLSRLEREETAARYDGLHYNVVYRLLNAADYGVPQRRERVVMVGFRQDLGIDWSFPDPTHSHDALLTSQWVTGEYWDRHRIATSDRPAPAPRHVGRIEKLRYCLIPPEGQPWNTVRDCIHDLPDPARFTDVAIANHRIQPGARPYVGHTGSALDEPAKTLKAGDHGVPGGENMLVFDDGRSRYFTVRESARIQTFPDDYVFAATWTESMRQLGNAVPVALGQAVARSVYDRLIRQVQ
jgi:DNA (cytosine-5)-methyltransferase 1